jgi:hypothetical protein
MTGLFRQANTKTRRPARLPDHVAGPKGPAGMTSQVRLAVAEGARMHGARSEDRSPLQALTAAGR